MLLSETLLNTKFCKVLVSFLSYFNSNIDWKNEIQTWIDKKKNDEYIIEKIRSACWINKDLVDYRNEEYYEFDYCNKILREISAEKVYILNYNKNMCSIKMEQKYYNDLKIIEKILTMREIKFEVLDAVENDCELVDLGWLFLSEENAKKISKFKHLHHFNLFNTNKLYPEYNNFFYRIYYGITCEKVGESDADEFENS